MTSPGQDEALVALEDLADTLEQDAEQLQALSTRARALVADRRRRPSWRDAVAAERRPLIVEELSRLLTRLDAVGARFRRAQARALRDEGLTQDRIAALFGVSRQRVASLLGVRAGG